MLDMVQRPSEITPAGQSLTGREWDVIALVSEGLSNKEIGRRLGLTEGTVKIHLHNIYQKLRVANRTALAVAAIGHASNAWPQRVASRPLPLPQEG